MLDDVLALGKRIRAYRSEKNLTAAQLADEAGISRSYLSELETGKGRHKRPSARVLDQVATVLGVSISELMGRPIEERTRTPRPKSLDHWAASRRIPQSDVEMLASIQFRGEPPQSAERWEFIYNAIRTSASMDPPRRRR